MRDRLSKRGTTTVVTVLGLIGLLSLGACADAKETADRGARTVDTTMGMGMGMPHRHSDMPGMMMVPMMRSHMDSMQMEMMGGAGGGMMSRHVEMVSDMLATMERDRRQMGLGGDSAWTALTDSVRRDLRQLPGFTGPGRRERMRAHMERMQRLLDLYQGLRPGA